MLKYGSINPVTDCSISAVDVTAIGNHAGAAIARQQRYALYSMCEPGVPRTPAL